MAGAPLVVRAQHKTSYKAKDIRRLPQQIVKEPKYEHNTYRQTLQPGKPSSPLRSSMARSPTTLILLYHIL